MSVLSDLKSLSAAEEFFDYLGVDYDPAVLAVSRLHVLRLMGNWLAETSLAGATDDDVRKRIAGQLATAYDSLQTSGPLEQRLFKVHKDVMKPTEPAGPTFVPLSTLTRS